MGVFERLRALLFASRHKHLCPGSSAWAESRSSAIPSNGEVRIIQMMLTVDSRKKTPPPDEPGDRCEELGAIGLRSSPCPVDFRGEVVASAQTNDEK
jgi:hypothetical protein